MSIDRHQLRRLVNVTLERMQMHSPVASDLMMGTIAAESECGHYIMQKGRGPAMGICQMEPATASDIVHRYVTSRSAIDRRFHSAFHLIDSHMVDWSKVDPDVLGEKLMSDNRFAIALARLKYWMCPEPLPKYGPLYIEALALYWKRNYNTEAGKGTVDHFLRCYGRYV